MGAMRSILVGGVFAGSHRLEFCGSGQAGEIRLCRTLPRQDPSLSDLAGTDLGSDPAKLDTAGADPAKLAGFVFFGSRRCGSGAGSSSKARSRRCGSDKEGLSR